MADDPVVEVLTTQVGVTSGCLGLKDTLLDREKRHIEGSSTEIEDEDVALALHLLVETVCDSGDGKVVDGMSGVETRGCAAYSWLDTGPGMETVELITVPWR